MFGDSHAVHQYCRQEWISLFFISKSEQQLASILILNLGDLEELKLVDKLK
jgi:hypothetical protein